MSPHIPATMAELLRPTGHPDFPATYPDTGMTVERRYTAQSHDPFDEVVWTTRPVTIKGDDGVVAFHVDDFEVPAAWSDLSAKIVGSKYARKRGVPLYDADGNLRFDEGGEVERGPEVSVRQTISRIANAFMFHGQKGGYFASEDDALAYRDELVFQMVNQRGANNSPVWFNVGLFENYGIVEDSEGNSYFDPERNEVVLSQHKYERAAVNACFITGMDDHLLGPGGITDYTVRETRLFKAGSGNGGNLSNVRAKGEPLTAGGTASGVVSFMRPADIAAGAIKSGGTTRRAAKMVVLDVDHPEVTEFIQLKAREERKVPYLLEAGYPLDWNAEDGVYQQLHFQNANHSVRILEGFMQARAEGRPWQLTARRDIDPETGQRRVMAEVDAAQLYRDIAQASWECADPGLQFDDILNDWNTAANDARLRASNPCSEYTHIDDTACNLASLNLAHWWDADTATFDVEGFEFSTRLWTLTLELAVTMSHYPSELVAKNSYEHRTLGLGYANIGGLLMRAGIAYDSDEGRAVAAAITSILNSVAYATSAEMARALEPCLAYSRNVEHVERVLANHRRAAYGTTDPSLTFDGLTVAAQLLDHDMLGRTAFANLGARVLATADAMVDGAHAHGVRNMQASVLAPTGTIGLLMDVDTTGVEPAFASVAFKTLAGGGNVTIVLQSVRPGLLQLGYSASEAASVETHIVGTRTLFGDTPVNAETLAERGVPADVIASVEAAVQSAAELGQAFGTHMLDEATRSLLGVPEGTHSFLGALQFTEDELEASDYAICGHQTIEGAPHVDVAHYDVFDTASVGRAGERSISWAGHVKMLGAVAPFLSGSASKTVNVPNEATVDDIEAVHDLAYELGVKCVAVYRDACKASQPLSAMKRKTESAVEATETVEASPLQLADLATTQQVEQLKELLASVGELPEGLSPSAYYGGNKPKKFRMPAVRQSMTEKFTVGDQDVFLTHGAYPDGTLGEVFIKLSKEGGTLEGMCAAFATAMSMGLQRGVPLEEFVEKFRHHRFEPAGVVQHPNLRMTKSILDAVVRILAYRYLGDVKAVNVPDAQPMRPGMVTAATAPAPVAAPHVAATVGAPEVAATAAPNGNGAAATTAVSTSPQGAVGKTCIECGEDAMFPNGSCDLCRACGATSGCS